jgi:hypothetical protein
VPRAGDAREEATMLADKDAILSEARRDWAMDFLTCTWPLPMRDDGESAQAVVRQLFLMGGWSDRGELDALDCACIAAALWGFQAGYGTARTYPEDADAGDGGH